MSFVINVLSSLCRCILVSNHLPIRATKQEETGTWEFEWDEDALIYQAQVSLSRRSCTFLCAKGPEQRTKSLVLVAHAETMIKSSLRLGISCMQDGLEDVEIMYVGCLPVELDPDEQDVRAPCIEACGLHVDILRLPWWLE